MNQRYIKLIFIGIIFLTFSSFVRADYESQRTNFFINPSFDLKNREQISATLRKISFNAYFYFDDDYWNSLDNEEQNKIIQELDSLSSEFESKIYPELTSFWGSEARPGIDNDLHITILIHPMKKEAGGYFNSGDGYLKIQNPKSNQREMFYFNASHLSSSLNKALLAHEFTHLISFNQKTIKQDISEETWLEEARAEYSPTFLGYDDNYSGSNLERRVKDFLNSPSDSIMIWQNKVSDYGGLNLFTQYLTEHYGRNILSDSLHSSKIGISSLNEALIKNGFKEDFSQIFTDWTIAVFLNNCSVGPKYCYKNPNLKNLRLIPQSYFLPLTGKSSLTVSVPSQNWQGFWLRFLGGWGDLKFEFNSSPGTFFKIPVILENSKREYKVSFLEVNGQKTEFFIPNFQIEIISAIVIPSLQTKFFGFEGFEPTYPLSLTASVGESKSEEENKIKELLSQIELLKKQIVEVQAQIDAILAKKLEACALASDLYFGMMAHSEVRCLQEFLKSQGSEIYPQGLVTGNFLDLTFKAVIRFQEKYADEILKPLGLEKGTGFVSSATRAKINQLLK